MSSKRDSLSTNLFSPTILDLDDSRTPPVFVWAGSNEESFRLVATEEIQLFLRMNNLGPASRAAALAELARRGISPDA